MENFKPWVKYPSLTAERLTFVAEIMRNTRAQTVDLYDPTAGERAWDLGCRVYSRTCHALRQAANNSDWLKALEKCDSLRFSFAIGNVPVRFYHGDAGTVPTHYLIATPKEAEQQALALKFEGLVIHDEIIRIAVETGPDQLVKTVTLVTMDQDGTALAGYSIPLRVQTPTIPGRPAPLEIAPPALEPILGASLPAQEPGPLPAQPPNDSAGGVDSMRSPGPLFSSGREHDKDTDASDK